MTQVTELDEHGNEILVLLDNPYWNVRKRPLKEPIISQPHHELG
ncbi:hypothetical protein [Mesorhizobium sp. M0041]